MFCAYTMPRYQVSVYRTIGPLVFSSVWVAEWPSFGKYLLTRLSKCCLCTLTTSISNSSYFPNIDKQTIIIIMITCSCNVHPLTPHFYIVKLGFTGVYIFFLFLLQNIDRGYSLEPPH